MVLLYYSHLFTQRIHEVAFVLALFIVFLFYQQYKKYRRQAYKQHLLDNMFKD